MADQREAPARRVRRSARRAHQAPVEGVHAGAAGSAGAPDPHRSASHAARDAVAARKQRARRIRRTIIAACAVAAALAIAAGVAVAALFGSVSGKIALKGSDAASALSPAASGEPVYTLVAADLDGEGRAGIGEGPDALALVRTDAGSGRVSAVSIPVTLPVTLKDGKQHPLRDASGSDGDASLVRAVAAFASVDVSHFVKIDAAGLVSLVDRLGGVELDVAEEVDDPAAGDVYLAVGRQRLDGAAALTFARATNFRQGSDQQAANQRALLAAIAGQLRGTGSVDCITRLDRVGGTFSCDLDAAGALQAAGDLRAVDTASVPGALVPGYESTALGTTTFTVSSAAWADMIARFTAGDDPAAAEQPALVDPGSFTLTVRNGGGVTGAAAQMSQLLSGKGFKVEETGNADVAVYTDTLVVYNDDAFEAAAATVVDALGMGRTVPGMGSYTFDTDVLVVLGKDWKPAN